MSPSYVVAPPSVHPDTGRRYAWQLPLQEAPLADFSLVTPSPGASCVLQREHQEPNTSYWGCPTGDTPSYCGQGQRRLAPVVRHQTQKRSSRWPGYSGSQRRWEQPFPASSILTQPLRRLHPAADTGEWLYRDFHAARHNAEEWLSLAQVRAGLPGESGGSRLRARHLEADPARRGRRCSPGSGAGDTAAAGYGRRASCTSTSDSFSFSAAAGTTSTAHRAVHTRLRRSALRHLRPRRARRDRQLEELGAIYVSRNTTRGGAENSAALAPARDRARTTTST